MVEQLENVQMDAFDKYWSDPLQQAPSRYLPFGEEGPSDEAKHATSFVAGWRAARANDK